MKIIFAILFFTVTSLCASAQQIDTLLDVGKYKLHINVLRGKGIPIIFESGAGNDGSIWNSILKPLHDALGSPIIVYDRQGFGKSGIDTSTVNIITEVEGLEIGLRKLGFSDKYFLVAHSLGGNYAIAFSQRNSGKVIGGVFIDIVTPCFMTAQKAIEVKNLFKDSLEVIKRESLGFYYILKNYEHTSKVMREAASSLKIPLTVICADKPPVHGSDSVMWKHCMKTFAAQVGNRKFVVAKDADHHIFIDKPELVIDEIIERYRKSSTIRPTAVGGELILYSFPDNY